jgi:uncharacterized protein (TIGR02466 family)
MIDTKLILPYLVSSSEDENFDDIRLDLIEWLNNYARMYPSNSRSNVHGYQSPDNFYKEKSFTPFLNYMSPRIMELVESHKNHEESNLQFQPRLSNMWFNINYKGSYNVYHTHPGSVLAGVLWVDIPENSGELRFHHHDEHNLSQSQNTTLDLDPVEGMMLLFPASLAHEVSMNYSEETRTSIAFNLFEPYE